MIGRMMTTWNENKKIKSSADVQAWGAYRQSESIYISTASGDVARLSDMRFRSGKTTWRADITAATLWCALCVHTSRSYLCSLPQCLCPPSISFFPPFYAKTEWSLMSPLFHPHVRGKGQWESRAQRRHTFDIFGLGWHLFYDGNRSEKMSQCSCWNGPKVFWLSG